MPNGVQRPGVFCHFLIITLGYFFLRIHPTFVSDKDCSKLQKLYDNRQSQKAIPGPAETNPWPKFKTEQRILLRFKTLPIQNESYMSRVEYTVQI
jgi:hypothetical protein